MIAAHINDFGAYWTVDERFTSAFAFLRSKALTSLTPGSAIEIDGQRVRAFVQEYVTGPGEQRRFETHEQHFDIQYVVSGEERFGISPRSILIPDGIYDPEKDVTFYESQEEHAWLWLRPGDFVVVGPEDAHKPGCTVTVPSEVTKIVIKIHV